MVQSVGLTPPLTTRDRELVSTLEYKYLALESNQRPLNPRSFTLPLTSPGIEPETSESSLYHSRKQSPK